MIDCPGGPGHVGPPAKKYECRRCLLPEPTELQHILDACLVHEGVVLSRRQLENLADLVRSYLAGRYALPLDDL